MSDPAATVEGHLLWEIGMDKGAENQVLKPKSATRKHDAKSPGSGVFFCQGLLLPRRGG